MTLARRIWHIVNVISLALLLLSGRIVYWQLARGQELQPVVLDPVAAAAQYRGEGAGDSTVPAGLETLPQPVIQRTQALLAEISRGTIYDRNGQPLAYEKTTDGNRSRLYTDPSLAHVIGYVSGLRTGVSGIEHSFNETLLGLDRLDTQVNRMVYQPIAGSDVYLTIDSRTQQAAAQALGDRVGAVVALDAHTGAILAMASQPTFDPNRMLDQAYVASLVTNCQDATRCPSPFLNRAAQGLYAPGSTWKTVTLVAALDTGLATPETVFDVGPPLRDERGSYYAYRVDGGLVVDRNHPEQVLNLERAYVTSANAVFAQLGDTMGAETLIEYAGRFGFSRNGGEAPPLEIAASPAQLANNPESLYRNNLLRAVTAIGQGELLASPLNMALVVAAVIQEGDVPNPHLLLEVRQPSGDLLRGEPGGDWIRQVMRPQTARQVRQMMIALVESGGPAVPGLTVGGKTGTAEVGGDRAPHAWFAGFAENGERTVAIAVVVENGGQGGQVAAPIFAQVAETALYHLEEPVRETAPVGSQ